MDIPYDLEAEECLIGAMAQSRQAREMASSVSAEAFYHPTHARLFEALVALDPGQPAPHYVIEEDGAVRIDLPGLDVSARDQGIFQSAWDACWSPLLAPSWIHRIQELTRRRRILAAAIDVTNSAAQDDRALAALELAVASG